MLPRRFRPIFQSHGHKRQTTPNLPIWCTGRCGFFFCDWVPVNCIDLDMPCRVRKPHRRYTSLASPPFLSFAAALALVPSREIGSRKGTDRGSFTCLCGTYSVHMYIHSRWDIFGTRPGFALACPVVSHPGSWRSVKDGEGRAARQRAKTSRNLSCSRRPGEGHAEPGASPGVCWRWVEVR